MTSRPERRVSTRPAIAESAQVPRDERLRQVDVAHEVGDRALALGEALDDAQARRVGERLVDDGDLPGGRPAAR